MKQIAGTQDKFPELLASREWFSANHSAFWTVHEFLSHLISGSRGALLDSSYCLAFSTKVAAAGT